MAVRKNDRWDDEKAVEDEKVNVSATTVASRGYEKGRGEAKKWRGNGCIATEPLSSAQHARSTLLQSRNDSTLTTEHDLNNKTGCVRRCADGGAAG